MKKLILILLLFPLFLSAQYAENIRTGRPGQGIGPYTLGKSVIQIQSGYNYNEVKSSSSTLKNKVLNTVLRLGITEKFEVSGLINHQSNTLNYSQNQTKFEHKINGFENLQLGARVNLTKNEGAMPAIGIQSRVLLKMSSNEYQREETGLKNILATANKLSDKFSFATNWILLYPGGNNELRTQYVVNLSYSISDKLGIFGESYGNLGNNSSTNFDGGISYLLNKDIQVDLSGGIQETKADSDYFIDFGFSWRTDWRK